MMTVNYYPFTNKHFFNSLSDSSKHLISYPGRAAFIYTEVFLMMSSFLMTRSVITKFENGKKVCLTRELLTRFTRIVPSFTAVILFSAFILPNIGSGPQWNLVSEEADLCRQFGWRNILMIHNWFGIEKICLPQTHHIATDFTLYAFSLLLIVKLFNYRQVTITLVIILGIASTIGRLQVSLNRELAIFLYFGVE